MIAYELIVFPDVLRNCDTEVADSATETLVPWNNSYNHSNFLNPIFIK